MLEYFIIWYGYHLIRAWAWRLTLWHPKLMEELVNEDNEDIDGWYSSMSGKITINYWTWQITFNCLQWTSEWASTCSCGNIVIDAIIQVFVWFYQYHQISNCSQIKTICMHASIMANMWIISCGSEIGYWTNMLWVNM